MFRRYSGFDFNIINEVKKRVEDKITEARLYHEKYPEEAEQINIINNQLKLLSAFS